MSSDAGVYVMHQSWGEDSLSPLIAILYVDDIIIMGTSLESVKLLEDDLQNVGNRGWLSHVHPRQGVARHTPLKC